MALFLFILLALSPARLALAASVPPLPSPAASDNRTVSFFTESDCGGPKAVSFVVQPFAKNVGPNGPFPLPLTWPATGPRVFSCIATHGETDGGSLAISFTVQPNDIVCAGLELGDDGSSALLIAPVTRNKNASAPACTGWASFYGGMQMQLPKVGTCAKLQFVAGEVGCQVPGMNTTAVTGVGVDFQD